MAAELDISNGHAARMRYSRFKQQMEGTATVTKNVKPKKANGKIESGKSVKQSVKGKSINEKSKSSCNSNTKAINNSKGDGSLMDGNIKKRPAPDDFIKQETQMKLEPVPSIESDQINDLMFDPFTNAMTFCTPADGVLTTNQTLPYMVLPELQPQPQQFFDPYADLTQPLALEGIMAFDLPFDAQNFSELPSSEPFGPTFTDPSEWDQMDFCFSGCCPPPYPPTPALFPDYATNQSENSIYPTPPEPWTQETPFQAPAQNQWVPIKSEAGDEISTDDILVKVEADA